MESIFWILRISRGRCFRWLGSRLLSRATWQRRIWFCRPLPHPSSQVHMLSPPQRGPATLPESTNEGLVRASTTIPPRRWRAESIWNTAGFGFFRLLLLLLLLACVHTGRMANFCTARSHLKSTRRTQNDAALHVKAFE